MTSLIEMLRNADLHNQDPDKQPVARQHNDLIRACYSMTLLEKQILALAMSRIYRQGQRDEKNRPIFILRVEDFIKTYNVTQKTIYNDLKKATRRLGKRQVLVHDRINGKRSEIGWFNWLDSCHYLESAASLVVRFAPTCDEYLYQAFKEIGNYTETALLEIADFRSFHTVRLYELICQYKDTGWCKLTISDLREILQTEDKYLIFSQFKKWVLNPAIKQINDRHKIGLKMEVTKKGRTPHLIDFTFKRIPHKDRTPANNVLEIQTQQKQPIQSTRERSLQDDLTDTSWAN